MASKGGTPITCSFACIDKYCCCCCCCSCCCESTSACLFTTFISYCLKPHQIGITSSKVELELERELIERENLVVRKNRGARYGAMNDDPNDPVYVKKHGRRQSNEYGYDVEYDEYSDYDEDAILVADRIYDDNNFKSRRDKFENFTDGDYYDEDEVYGGGGLGMHTRSKTGIMVPEEDIERFERMRAQRGFVDGFEHDHDYYDHHEEEEGGDGAGGARRKVQTHDYNAYQGDMSLQGRRPPVTVSHLPTHRSILYKAQPVTVHSIAASMFERLADEFNVNDMEATKVMEASVADPSVLVGWQIELFRSSKEQLSMGVKVVVGIKRVRLQHTKFLLRGSMDAKGGEHWTQLKRAKDKEGKPFRVLRRVNFNV